MPVAWGGSSEKCVGKEPWCAESFTGGWYSSFFSVALGVLVDVSETPIPSSCHGEAWQGGEIGPRIVEVLGPREIEAGGKIQDIMSTCYADRAVREDSDWFFESALWVPGTIMAPPLQEKNVGNNYT